ncbi:tetratricopeptide repeat protein [Corallococcus exercitus]|uniref:tetratricopeptide repeat protein n=1 Tax=Corallococcus exercitus TaxID=2316736 RepID=UPI0035D438AA
MEQAASTAGVTRSLLARPGLQYGLVVLASLLVFAGSLANGFVYDDNQLVLENPWVRSAAGMREVFSQPLFGFMESSTAQDPRHHYYRPLMHVFLFVLRQGFGLQAWAHHLALMLMHASVSALTLWFLRASLFAKRPAREDAAAWAALAGALFFALHPVHTEAVAWVAGAMDVGMALAVLVAVRLWWPVPATPARALAAGGVWLLGLLLKETAVVLPVLLWVMERVWTSAEARGGLLAQVRRFALLGLGFVAYAGLRLSALGGALPSGHGGRSLLVRVIGTLAFPADLGGKLVWPVPLSVASPGGLVESAADPRVWVGAVIILAVLALGLWAWRRQQEVMLAGWLWLVVPFLPAMALQARGVDAYAERYLYLPSIGFTLWMALGVRGLLSRWPEHARTVALATGGVLGAFTLLTVFYVPVWRDDLTLWTYVQETSKDQPLIHANLGNLHLNAGRVREAIPELEIAVRGMGGEFRVHNNLAVAYAKAGRFGDARKELERTVRLMPDNPVAWHNLGLVSRNEGDLETAIARFQDALRLAPKRVDSLMELGRTLLRAGRPSEAVPPLEEALRLEPGLVAARRALAQARSAASAPPR